MLINNANMDKMIYSIVMSDQNLDDLNAVLACMKGISGSRLYRVSFGDISAVVSNINKADVAVNASNAIEFARVAESLVQQFSLLPMRFGSMIESIIVIKKLLEKNYNEILQNLQKVGNKAEFGLRVIVHSERINAECKAKARAKPTLETAKGKENSIYRDYLSTKLLEHRFEEFWLEYVDTVIKDITNRLALLNPIQRIKKKIKVPNIIDAAFLIEKNQTDKLIGIVEELQNRDNGSQYLLTGPWPPYNFVDITLK